MSKYKLIAKNKQKSRGVIFQDNYRKTHLILIYKFILVYIFIHSINQNDVSHALFEAQDGLHEYKSA